MSPGKIRAAVVAGRLQTIESMLSGIESLPLEPAAAFLAEPRIVAAGESFLRRSLEALFDLGRHLLSKAFADPASEYKAIAYKLGEHDVLALPSVELLVEMAGYRNRLVHFYDEVTPAELRDILRHNRADVARLANELRAWISSHPELVDENL